MWSSKDWWYALARITATTGHQHVALNAAEEFEERERRALAHIENTRIANNLSVGNAQ